ncbi:MULTISPECIES: acyl carrier protein [Stenotrophomonas]|jgi:Phosphopantetheine attachment site.|uniref:acyl carrier protein n=1 Tax=Stenotrophomonas TaxID=40323 RepID=UPI0004457874|nr:MULTISPECIES: phosphopantetheine-binding protein [Stenotrophomonas]EZP42208.1 D-alanine--poly(phosphoribitol) ligase subunit 2 [Stenotrophomonas sp. RIT309]MCX2892647.1 phosphopantetheine-binding protein [Stenotrophomonas lactitubi]QKW58119.1 acyl carrier protein [Stenotrophomonas sp. NA06056]WGV55851.1 phosphopantetheine-binding protein [Stenotrophomonas indicatrix]CAH0261677.1 D-alanine--poly(phosphoribitol) ligase subunit 2 [Stenotrophomonas lactitubi]
MDKQTIQNQLIDIVEAVIGTRVQPDEYMESFFDSMSKVQLMVEVKDRLGVTLPVDEIDALVDSVQVLADYVAEHRPS